ncbi:hypothetical protein ACIBCR_16580 [Micromonospora echinospora]|uniref:hypothetical protein n=1 Tax=Micromonospora echinospora TaxID=1877 RepID=UPI0037900195
MTTQSRTRDPIDEDTSSLHLPTGGEPAVYSTCVVGRMPLSRLLTASLCTAVPLTIATILLAIIEEVRNNAAVTSTTMMLTTAGSAVSWIGVITVASRDWIIRHYQALHSLTETIQARQIELYRRQEHLAGRIANLANLVTENGHTIRALTTDVTAIRASMDDVLGVADADAELQLRQAVNGPRAGGGGLYIVE